MKFTVQELLSDPLPPTVLKIRIHRTIILLILFLGGGGGGGRTKNAKKYKKKVRILIKKLY
jgi:hypothetical protein